MEGESDEFQTPGFVVISGGNEEQLDETTVAVSSSLLRPFLLQTKYKSPSSSFHPGLVCLVVEYN